jgi:hypothetical protein
MIASTYLAMNLMSALNGRERLRSEWCRIRSSGEGVVIAPPPAAFGVDDAEGLTAVTWNVAGRDHGAVGGVRRGPGVCMSTRSCTSKDV